MGLFAFLMKKCCSLIWCIYIYATKVLYPNLPLERDPKRHMARIWTSGENIGTTVVCDRRCALYAVIPS